MGAAYALGAAVSVTTSDSKNGQWQHSTTTTNSFAWWDGAVQSQVSFAKTDQPTYFTSYTYGGSGQLASISIQDGRPRSVAFVTDMLGQVIRRDESGGSSAGDPHEVWYRFNGRQLGYTGNNGTLDTDYPGSIFNRMRITPQAPGDFRFGATSGTASIDFDPSLDPINSYAQGSAGGGYTVRAGDTLAGIALSLWGDSSLWYKLAEANGLTAASGLIEGRNLIVPHGIQSNHHNASTLKPYDPAEAIGDTGPTSPKPQKKGKCGMFGVILLVVIAVAVAAIAAPAIIGAPAVFAGGSMVAPATGLTAILGGTAAAAGSAAAITAGVVGGAIAGAAASVVSQGVGLTVGIQSKFSWKNVAFSAISGAVGGGVGGALGKGAMLGSQFVGDVVRGAAGNALTQGVGVALGLQKKFDFAAVAAAGIGAGITAGFAREAFGVTDGNFARNMVGRAQQFASSTAGAIANAATRTLADGTDFGDNLLAALPDVIGSTIGNMVADPVLARMEASAQDRIDRGLSALAAKETLARLAEAERQAAIAVDRKVGWTSGLEDLADALPGGAELRLAQVRVDSNGIPNVDGEGRSLGQWMYDVITEKIGLRPDIVGRETDSDRARAIQMGELSIGAYDVLGGNVEGFNRIHPSQLDLNSGMVFNARTGFKAAIYSRGRETVVAFAGTDIWSTGDWRTNVRQAFGLLASQYQQALRVGRAVQQRLGRNVTLSFTGHSLGGGLAAFVANVLQRPAITFNAAGVSPATILANGGSSNNAGYVLNYRHWGDPLSAWQNALPLPNSMGRTINVGPPVAYLGASGNIGNHLMGPMMKALRSGSGR